MSLDKTRVWWKSSPIHSASSMWTPTLKGTVKLQTVPCQTVFYTFYRFLHSPVKILSIIHHCAHLAIVCSFCRCDFIKIYFHDHEHNLYLGNGGSWVSIKNCATDSETWLRQSHTLPGLIHKNWEWCQVWDGLAWYCNTFLHDVFTIFIIFLQNIATPFCTYVADVAGLGWGWLVPLPAF